jgi:hypothetical protein
MKGMRFLISQNGFTAVDFEPLIIGSFGADRFRVWTMSLQSGLSVTRQCLALPACKVTDRGPRKVNVVGTVELLIEPGSKGARCRNSNANHRGAMLACVSLPCPRVQAASIVRRNSSCLDDVGTDNTVLTATATIGRCATVIVLTAHKICLRLSTMISQVTD